MMMNENTAQRKKTKRMNKKTLVRKKQYLTLSDAWADMLMHDAVEENPELTTRFLPENYPAASPQSTMVYYLLLCLKVGLWLVFAWILSHLHLGAPCSLLPLILWLYSEPLSKATKWAKRRLLGSKKVTFGGTEIKQLNDD